MELLHGHRTSTATRSRRNEGMSDSGKIKRIEKIKERKDGGADTKQLHR